jgi:hypothetical protein
MSLSIRAQRLYHIRTSWINYRCSHNLVTWCAFSFSQLIILRPTHSPPPIISLLKTIIIIWTIFKNTISSIIIVVYCQLCDSVGVFVPFKDTGLLIDKCQNASILSVSMSEEMKFVRCQGMTLRVFFFFYLCRTELDIDLHLLHRIM